MSVEDKAIEYFSERVRRMLEMTDTEFAVEVNHIDAVLYSDGGDDPYIDDFKGSRKEQVMTWLNIIADNTSDWVAQNAIKTVRISLELDAV